METSTMYLKAGSNKRAIVARAFILTRPRIEVDPQGMSPIRNEAKPDSASPPRS